jgi:hypothetical protein
LRGSSRPSTEAQMKFDVLMQIFDNGQNFNTQQRVSIIDKFLAISDPGIEKIKWNRLLSMPQTKEIINIVRWGMNEFRQGKPFIRQGPRKSPTFGPGDQSREGIQWDRTNGRVIRVGSVTVQHRVLTLVFELLTEVAPWLRICQRKECGRLFLYQRPKQIYCSDSCAQRVRMERFLAQRAVVSGKH